MTVNEQDCNNLKVKQKRMNTDAVMDKHEEVKTLISRVNCI